MAGYGGVVTLRRDRTYLVNDPEAIGRIFQDNHFNYVKGERYIRALEPLFGRGLLTSEGDLWRRQRRLIQPVFHRANHDAYAQVIVQETEARSAHWREAARTGTALDVREEMTELTLAILMRTVFGQASGEEIDEVGQAFLAAHHEMNITAAFLPVQIPRWVPTPGRRRFARALATIDHFIGRMIDARQGSDNLGTDFLSRLLAARDPGLGCGDAPATGARRGHHHAGGRSRHGDRGADVDVLSRRAASRGGGARPRRDRRGRWAHARRWRPI